MPLRHLPLQRKLVGFILLTSLTVLLLSYLPLLIYETRSSYQTTRGHLSTVGEIIASNSTAAMIYDDQPFATELLAALQAEPDVVAAALFDKDGKVFAVYRREPWEHAAAGVAARGRAGGRAGDVTLYRPVTQGNARVGTLFIESNLEAMYGRLRIYGLVLLGVLIGAGVLAFFLSNFLQRQISRPILSLAETAKTISKRKDYSVRAVKSSGDELGFVTEAFNSMLEQIELNHAVLGESEERFRAVADNAPVLIWLADPDRLCTWVNQHWLDFTGLPAGSEISGVWRDSPASRMTGSAVSAPTSRPLMRGSPSAWNTACGATTGSIAGCWITVRRATRARFLSVISAPAWTSPSARRPRR